MAKLYIQFNKSNNIKYKINLNIPKTGRVTVTKLGLIIDKGNWLKRLMLMIQKFFEIFFSVVR